MPGPAPTADAATPSSAQARAGAARSTASVIELARGLLHEVPGLIGDRVELFSLELRRASITLAKVLALTVVAAILAVTAWLALWSILVGLLIAGGWHPAAANGLVALINIVAAVWAVRHVRALTKLLSLPATRHHLTLGSGSSSGLGESRSAPDEQRAVHERQHPAAAA